MLDINWIDKAVGYVSPQRGAARAEARTRMRRMHQLQAMYEGASLSRRTQHWRAVGTDVNVEVMQAGGRLRDVARDMVRNNALAQRVKSTVAHDVVGAGIMPKVVGSESRATRVQELLKQHLDKSDIDADGLLNLSGLQSLAMSTVVESGECLIRKRLRRKTDGYALPFQIQLLEPDYLDISVDGQQANGNYAIQGIEFDLRGKRVAYHLFDQHPGSIGVGRNIRSTSSRVSADFCTHVFRVDRPGQVRGVSWFAPVMVLMRDWQDYRDAQLMRQKISACFAAFISRTSDILVPTGMNPDGTPSAVPQYSNIGNPVEAFEPGMIERLRDGESVTFATPPSTSDFGPYSVATQHEIAAGMNVPYEAVTGDWSNVNYSSGRMGHLSYQRGIETWRWNMLIPMMLDPIEQWIFEAVSIATGSSEPYDLEWTPPRREMIDPDTELNSASKAIRAGLSSRQSELRKLGYDPEQIHREIEEDNEIADDKGFIFDSDARLTTNRGVAQKNEPNKAAPKASGDTGGGFGDDEPPQPDPDDPDELEEAAEEAA